MYASIMVHEGLLPSPKLLQKEKRSRATKKAYTEIEREIPAIKVGGEVDERLDASKRLEQVGLVDGEGVARVDAAPLRRLLLQ